MSRQENQALGIEGKTLSEGGIRGARLRQSTCLSLRVAHDAKACLVAYSFWQAVLVRMLIPLQTCVFYSGVDAPHPPASRVRVASTLLAACPCRPSRSRSDSAAVPRDSGHGTGRLLADILQAQPSRLAASVANRFGGTWEGAHATTTSKYKQRLTKPLNRIAIAISAYRHNLSCTACHPHARFPRAHAKKGEG
eukprot:1630024-Pleurochrysis_carterae.AAC.5